MKRFLVYFFLLTVLSLSSVNIYFLRSDGIRILRRYSSKQVLQIVILLGIVWFMLISCVQNRELSEEEVPSNLPKFEILLNEKPFDGYIFLKSTTDGAQIMINSAGKIVWYHLSDTTLAIEYRPYAKSYLSLYSNKELHEITYQGDTLLELSYGEGGFDRTLHHEIIKDKENDIIGLTNEVIAIDLSAVGGGQNDTIKTNGIIKLSSTGHKLWSWTPDQVLDPLTFPEINKHKLDWGHANALMIDEDDNYLISWRDFNEVWKIDSETGELIWRYGGVLQENTNGKFYQQHSINKNMDGDYMVFDNGLTGTREYSRALMFGDFEGTLRNTHSIDLADSLFTTKKGSVYQFAKDRFLFCSTMSKTLLVTNRSGDVLWLAKSDEEFYRAYYLDKPVLY